MPSIIAASPSRIRASHPLTYLVEAERALFMGEVFAMPVLYGALVAIAVALVGLAVGVSQVRKASRPA